MSVAQYCTFGVGGLLIGIEVERVREILSDPDVTPVPLAAPDVLGLLNLRGEIVTVIDARQRLGLLAAADDHGGPHVIIGTEGETVSLVVDTEEDVADVDPATAQPVPDTIRADVRRLLRAIYELDNGPLMLVLDFARDSHGASAGLHFNVAGRSDAAANQLLGDLLGDGLVGNGALVQHGRYSPKEKGNESTHATTRRREGSRIAEGRSVIGGSQTLYALILL